MPLVRSLPPPPPPPKPQTPPERKASCKRELTEYNWNSNSRLSMSHKEGLFFSLAYRENRKRCLKGCLHDTRATFAPERVHSGSLSQLYICLHDTTTNFMLARVTPARVHPGSCTGARISLRYEISQRYHEIGLPEDSNG